MKGLHIEASQTQNWINKPTAAKWYRSTWRDRIYLINNSHFQWPWTTPTPGFKVTPFFDAEYLRNGTTYRHSCNGILMGLTHALLNSAISNDLEWLSKISNDTKRRTVSLRQLSFLFWERKNVSCLDTGSSEKHTTLYLITSSRVWAADINANLISADRLILYWFLLTHCWH